MNRTEKLKRNLSTESLTKLRKRTSKKENPSEVCPICQASFKDPVKTTCKASHEFCFSCIIQWVSTKDSLESCPLCRGGDKFIIINEKSVKKEYSYNSLNHFLLSKKLLQKILHIKGNENSCLISEKLLLTYVKNKEQLELALESRMSEDKLVKLINWDVPVFDDDCQTCSYTYRLRPRLTTSLTRPVTSLTRPETSLRQSIRIDEELMDPVLRSREFLEDIHPPDDPPPV